ncbi:NUMOD4 domain-containing protein [Burkholderia seminalis]|uniref:NUMOD4 domain-containing protein n=1 Tax=Burkholderia seminalis TaxID=488731 RepID=UPI0019080465|nr:HNH endonuclease [Burkholderia seminalis]MBJ9964454.1 HNH endonuclease [Burkholderia seminalis]
MSRKEIPGWPGYLASENGEIFSTKSGRSMKPTKNQKGYMRVTLSHDGHTKTLSVHSLILLTFEGPRPDGLVVRHLDGDTSNNAYRNLKYGSDQENEEDKLRHGKRLYGEKSNNVVLTEEAVREIRAAKQSGKVRWGSAALAKKFGVCRSTVEKAAKGQHWIYLDKSQRQEKS